ncbi:MAG: polysulfide reductase NrfD [Magnetococcales bacterium]|nr:polysulfide reductase NrfD [Magnetococcales bacterium]
MFEYMSFNIAPWGSELTIYFFLIGMGGMSFALATSPSMFGKAFKVFEPVQMMGLGAAFLVVAICGPLLITDLGQPGRFLYPIIHFHWTSPLSWGATFLVLFTACIVIYAWGLKTGQTGILKPVAIIGSLLGLSMPLYTGLDLMVNTTREVWATPWMPLLFTVLSVTSGAALMSLIAMMRNAEGAMAILRTTLQISVGVTFFLFLGLWVTLLYGSEELHQAWEILNGEFSFFLWVLTFLVGILVPLGALFLPSLSRQPGVVVLAGITGSIGAYTFRHVILLAGQMPQLYF